MRVYTHVHPHVDLVRPSNHMHIGNWGGVWICGAEIGIAPGLDCKPILRRLTATDSYLLEGASASTYKRLDSCDLFSKPSSSGPEFADTPHLNICVHV